jgi:hypothetical protein
MIDLLKLLSALLWPTFIGWVVVSLIVGKTKLLSSLEKLALSFLLGCGMLSLLMLLLGVCRISLTWPNIVLASALLLAAPLYLAVKQRVLTLGPWQLAPGTWTLTELILLSLITLRSAFVLFENLIKPVIGVDAFANWSLRAKVFFIQNSLVLDPQSSFLLGGGAKFYPIHLPLLESWVFSVLGYWNDALVKIVFFAFFVALVTLFYGAVRRSAPRIVALLGTYLLTTLPLLVHHAAIEYADLPLAIYFGTATLLLLNYCEADDDRYLWLSAILAGIGAWTKNEGFALVLVNLLILALFYFRSKKEPLFALQHLAGYFVIALLFKAPWSIINYVYRIPPNEFQKIHWEQIITNLYRLPVIAQYFYQKLLFYGNWNIAWFALVVVVLLAGKRLKDGRGFYSLFGIGLFLAMIAFMYYLTENYRWLLDGTTLNRNILLIMPLVVYFIAVNLPGLLAAAPVPAPKQPKRKK